MTPHLNLLPKLKELRESVKLKLKESIQRKLHEALKAQMEAARESYLPALASTKGQGLSRA